MVQENATYRAARCVRCAKEIPFAADLSVCPDCGGNLDLLLDFDFTAPDRKKFSLLPDFHMGRYYDFLPLPGLGASAPGVGGTPLLLAPRLGQRLDCRRLYLKDETRNPSGSLKDRATLAVLLAARAGGVMEVATASTGNAAASLAALAPRLEMEAIVFAPANAPAAKLRQVQVHGARLYRVDGNYDRAFELCREACAEMGLVNRSTGINPFCSHRNCVSKTSHGDINISSFKCFVSKRGVRKHNNFYINTFICKKFLLFRNK